MNPKFLLTLSLLMLLGHSAAYAQWEWEVLDLGFAEIQSNTAAYDAAIAQGEQTFSTYCVVCHGENGNGMPGVPILSDQESLWGNGLADMAYVIKYGIRSGHEKSRFSQMPAYGNDELGNGYDAQLLSDLTYYVGFLRGEQVPEDAVARAEETAMYVCTECHGFDFAGQTEWYGAPSLIDDVSLYGHDYTTVYNAIEVGSEGQSPVWATVLTDNQIRDVTLYIDSVRN